MVDLETVGEIMHSCTTLVCMSDYNHLVPSIDEFGRKLIDVTLDSSGLRVEEIAHHCDAVPRCHVDVRPNDFLRGDCIVPSATFRSMQWFSISRRTPG